jgi:chemosensory pili system protein ChpA (sensor histidine kinase/response regulator)
MHIDEATGVMNSHVGSADLGPLAWVLDELRKSLEVANKSLRRFVRDAEAARGTDLGAIDASQLRAARQQMHQAVGALEMVGLGAPAQALRAMESAVQQFVQHPEKCSEAAAATLERASFALVEYLDVLMTGATPSAVGLFPHYRDAQVLAGAERIHPADLWLLEWRWVRPVMAAARAGSLRPEPASRPQIDQDMLRVMQKGDAQAATELSALSLVLASEKTQGNVAIFWSICAAYFEAIARALLPVDVYVKRAVSQILLQYAAYARGDQNVSDRFAKDLLFFCAQARPLSANVTPCLVAVRKAYGLTQCEPVDYEVRRYGQFDPAIIAQARKRIDAVKETWSAVAGGDLTRMKHLLDQFGLMADSIVKLHPQSEQLALCLRVAAETTVRSAKLPSAELALEVATAVLYLEAAFVDRSTNANELAVRTRRLAERLEHVLAGQAPDPLEPWMEELYRRVSDRQTMGTVVGELRTTLGEAEKALDQFFRNPVDQSVLSTVPTLLAQMRGVLSVLGLDQAVQAVARMRDSVERILSGKLEASVEQAQLPGAFDNLGNNMGALGFLIDMLNYQPTLARKLFVFDAASGELKPLMGRTEVLAVVPDEAPQLPEDVAEVAEAVQVPEFVDLGFAEPVSTAPAPAVPESAPVDGLSLDFDLADVVIPDLSPAVMPEKAPEPLALAPASVSAQVAAPATVSAVTRPAAPIVVPAEPVAADAEGDDDDGELLDIFLEEVGEVIQNGMAALATLDSDPRDMDSQTTLRRAFHTLKGSSRMVGLMEFGEAAWSFEQLLNSWLASQKPASPELRGLAHEAFDAFEQWAADIRAGHAAQWQATPFQHAADSLRQHGVRVALLAELAPAGEPVEPVLGSADMSVEVVELSDHDAAVAMQGFDVHSAAEADEAVFAGIDLGGDIFDLPAAKEAEASPVGEAVPEVITVFEALPEAQPEGLTAAQAQLVGELCISAPLYSVYLSEAGGWADRLLTLLSDWSHDTHHSVPADAQVFAHSLAGSSSTVGFAGLSDLARALEHALHAVEEQVDGLALQRRVFKAAAQEIHTLFGQFAAGTLLMPNADLLEELKSLHYHDAAPALQEAEPELAAAVVEEAAPVLDMDFDIVDISAPEPAVSEPVVPEPVMPELAVHTAPAAAPAQTAPKRVDVLADVVDHGDDDIDLVDALDPDLFPIFEEEALELLPVLGGSMRQWVEQATDMAARGMVLRALHTLKGSARLAGALRLGEMAHRMESEIESLGTEAVQSQDIAALMSRVDAMEAKLEGLRQAQLQVAMPDVVELRAEPVLAPVAVTPALVAPVVPQIEVPKDLVSAVPAAIPAPVVPQVQPVPSAVVAQPVPMVAAPVRAAANQTVRVRSQLLDRLVNQAGEVMIARSRLEAELSQLRSSLQDLTGNLDRLRKQLRDVELQAESQMQSRMAQAKDSQQNFDPLEFDRFTRVQELTRMMAESVNDVATVQRSIQRSIESAEDDLISQARLTRALQQDLLRTRMMEFDGISERLYRVVRQAAKESGKQVKLDIVGSAVEMDRGVLDRMTAAFEHLLRNCVAHGIETPQERVAVGKDPVGTVTIELHQSGNDVSVTFQDDGAGLNVARIMERAVQQGLVPIGHKLSDDELAGLIFMPGFSTATEVTELSGRGIGMDVVRSEVQSLGGRIETSTHTGRGSRFKLVLPLTTAVTQVVLMRSGTLSVGVPAGVVELVRRVTEAEVKQAYSQGYIDFDGEKVPFFWSGALLQSSTQSTEPPAKNMSVVIFRSAAQRVAMHVDQVLGNQEAVVKNLGPQLSRLPGLAGMTVLASGAVVLIYNPVALAAVYGEQALKAACRFSMPPPRRCCRRAVWRKWQHKPRWCWWWMTRSPCGA